MTKVSGIDFTDLNRTRNSVTVRMPDESVCELPLIVLRDMPIANTYLRENDMLATKYAIVVNKINQKIEAIEAAGSEEEHTDTLTDAEVVTLTKASDSMITMQRELRELHVQLGNLCEEVRGFISKYFKDDSVIKCLECADNTFTIKVLQLMCYGDAFVTQGNDLEEPENPTETLSQSN